MFSQCVKEFVFADHPTCNQVADDPVTFSTKDFSCHFQSHQFYSQGRNIGIIVSLKDLNPIFFTNDLRRFKAKISSRHQSSGLTSAF